MNENDVYEVHWVDSGTWHENGWETIEGIKSDEDGHLSTVMTTGRFLFKDEHKMVLALSWDPKTKSYYGLQFIALSNVTAVIKLGAEDVISLDF